MTVSGYGGMIAFGFLVSGAAMYLLVKRFSLNFYDALILAVYGIAAGMYGAKVSYLLLNLGCIDWTQLTDWAYLSALLRGGFIFYGGIPAGIAGVFLAGRLHHIPAADYLHVCIPVLPLAHAFGRIGCCLAGCCYGIPYGGPLAITYHHTAAAAPVSVSLFPVQLLEAFLEFLIFLFLLRLVFQPRGKIDLFLLYLLLYSPVRFCLEFLRADVERGRLLWFSTSQWISLSIFIGVLLYTIVCPIGKRESYTSPESSP